MRAPLLGGLLAALLAVTLAADHAAARHTPAHWDFESEADVARWTVTEGGFGWAPGRGVGGSAGAALSPGLAATARAIHAVAIVAGGSYRIEGRFLSSDGEIDWTQLSVVLYTRQGRVVDAPSGGRLILPAQWSATFVAPCDAVSGDVEIASRGAAGSRAFVDEIRLELIAAPSSPCPAPSPTPTATRPPTAPPETNPPSPIERTDPNPGSPLEAPSTVSLPRSGLLANGGFEVAEDGRPAGWRTYGGVLTQVPSPVRSGRHAAALSSSTASTKWAYQVVPVSSASWYEFDGYVYHDDPRVEAALLRVSWYASADGSGRALASTDSTSALEQPEARYRYLTTGPVRAPPGAGSARARVLLRPRSTASAVIYIDDVSFRPTAPAPLAAEESQEASQASARSSRRGSSGGTGLSYRSEALPSTPLPTPVVVRSSHLRARDASTADGSATSWPWAVVGAGGVVAGAGTAGVWWRRRGRKA